MVSQRVYDYLFDNYGLYPTYELKEKLLSKGYSLEEYGEALALVKSKKSLLKSTNKKTTVSSRSAKSYFSFWIFIGFLFCIVLLAYSFFLVLFSFSLSFFFIPNILVGIIYVGLFLFSLIFYFFGFYKLGSFSLNRILKVSSFCLLLFYLLLILSIGFFCASLFSYFSGFSDDLTAIPFMTGNAILNDLDNIDSGFYSEIGSIGSFTSLFSSFIVNFISVLPFSIKLLFILNCLFLFCFLISSIIFSIGLFMGGGLLYTLSGVLRFCFTSLLFIFSIYFFYVFACLIGSPDYLVFLISGFSNYSFFLLTILKFFCILNFLCFCFEATLLYIGRRG